MVKMACTHFDKTGQEIFVGPRSENGENREDGREEVDNVNFYSTDHEGT
ncbi:hypothetical protein J2X69_000464 [Algoriphagus sp. 4150]|nr:hypothetical protein [Algoriphagus sp. 4150]